MDLTKWVKLWEKCPELDPFTRGFNGERYIHVQMLGGGLAMSSQVSIEENPELASALQRDRAVLVGGEKWGLSMWRHCEGRWVVDVNEPDICVEHPEPTEALYLAVCKVLGLTP